MEKIELQQGEFVIVERKIGHRNCNYNLLLTDKKLILYTTKKKLFRDAEIADYYEFSLNDFSLVDGEPFYFTYEYDDTTTLCLIYKRNVIELYDDEKEMISLGEEICKAIRNSKIILKTCTECGAEVVASTKFCNACGNKIQE